MRELRAHYLLAAESVAQHGLFEDERGGAPVTSQDPLPPHALRDSGLNVVAEPAPLLVCAQDRAGVVLSLDQPRDHPAAVGTELPGPLVQRQPRLLGAP